MKKFNPELERARIAENIQTARTHKLWAGKVNPVEIRKALGVSVFEKHRAWWDDSWVFDRKDNEGRVIVSVAEYDDTHVLWIHASISYKDRMPQYEDLKLLHKAVFGSGWSYQVFAPPTEHVNEHKFCLHLFGRLDRQPALPNFAPFGTI